MSNSFFAFKQFTINQDQCAMKVGTDGVILGAWVNLADVSRILDVGTGTGLIAIMCAQRSAATIDALEIDEAACLQAANNMKQCPWRERLSAFHLSFHDFCIKTDQTYDLVISNPPYFRNSLKPPEYARSLARHDDRLTYESLLSDSAKVLSDDGKLAVIIPAGEMNNFTRLAWFNGLFPERQTFIRHHAGKNYSRCLAEFTRKYAAPVTGELIIMKQDSNRYADEFEMLTRDFYLKL